MKKLTLLTAAIVFAGMPLLTAAETLDGVISDARCNGKHSKAEHGSQEESDAVVKSTPLGRWGGEDEIAKAVTFLIESDFVTGETIRVDGGRHVK